MELWSAGFNAWGQLQFGEASPLKLDIREDLTKFTCILRDKSIDILKTSISATLVQTSLGLQTAGLPDEIIFICKEKRDNIENLALAGNDQVAEFRNHLISQYGSLKDFPKGRCNAFVIESDIKKLEANETSFTALSSTGQVYTWGDARYGQCLGRDVTEESPALEPYIVEDIAGLPDSIVKISSGGYITAALTSGNDVYFWGRASEPKDLITGYPTPLDLDGKDILDVGVGFNHMVVLTTERKLFMIGDGSNGQLGLNVKKTEDWKEVLMPFEDGKRIVGVHAGYKNSFLLVENAT